jgi:N-acetylglucosamine-6-sulfatase
MARNGAVSRTAGLAAVAVAVVLLGSIGGPRAESTDSPVVTAQDPAFSNLRVLPDDVRATLPDVVVVLTDDQRLETLAGMPHVRSLLADQGTTFSQAMVPTSLCCPSRASMLTGSYAHDTGVWSNVRPHGGWWAFQDHGNEDRTLALALQNTGYRTALVGKYFNLFGKYAPTGYRPPGWDTFTAFTTVDRSGDYYDYTLSDGRAFGSRPADYSTDVLAATATDVIRSTPADQRLFLWFAPYAPHSPFRPAPRHRDAEVADLSLPGGSRAEDVTSAPAWVRRLAPVPPDKLARVPRRQQRALMAVDEAVADVVAALSDTGRLANTLIVFTSDNGLLWGEHGILDKNVPYAPATRVPLVLRWDGHVAAGTVDDRLALNIDLTATIAAAASTGMTTEGLDLLATGSRDGFVLEATEDPGLGRPAYCGWREVAWTFVRYATGEEELYSLADDPGERANLAGSFAHRARQEAMRDLAREHCAPEPPGFDW